MSYYSEVGHGKNVANFEDLISRCTSLGVTYNPSLAAIKIANLTILRTNALTAINNELAAETDYNNAVDNKELVFKPLQKMATRILHALKACGANKLIVKDAQSIVRKIYGKRAKPVKEAASQTNSTAAIPQPVQAVHISVSHLGADSMIEHYSRLIDLLASVPAYNPNETELKISGLNALLASMKAANTAVINATTVLNNMRITRNDVLYKTDNGLVDVAQQCKSYVKSIYGAQHPKYKEVSKIKFTKRKI